MKYLPDYCFNFLFRLILRMTSYTSILHYMKTAGILMFSIG